MYSHIHKWSNDILLCYIGYNDIGEIWRKEIDIPDLQKVAKNLMDDIKPFYRLLHGILRYVLHERINYFEYFHKNGTIPAHILGNKIIILV